MFEPIPTLIMSIPTRFESVVTHFQHIETQNRLILCIQNDMKIGFFPCLLSLSLSQIGQQAVNFGNNAILLSR
jgi:hypothetical protein